ncbi:MAG: hypothetical protein L0177_17440 [Chloroflexi bacterium]|nr:hypothetical protein [Chloroflexota bacterium]
MRRFTIAIVASFVLGIAGGAAIVFALGPFGDAEVEVVEGVVTAVNDDASAIGVVVREGEDAVGFDILGAMWRRDALPWNQTFPTCITAGATGQNVRLGVVDVAATDRAPAAQVVVWLECL